MNKFFVDSDVIIDLLIDRTPFSDHSTHIFNMASMGKIELWMSSLSVNNIYYVIRKPLGEKKAKEVIRELTTFIQIEGVGKREIVEALSLNFKDFEDAIQYSTATRIAGVKAILTRNSKDYKNSKIAVFTPEVFLKTFKL